jgi:hypothetical protein
LLGLNVHGVFSSAFIAGGLCLKSICRIPVGFLVAFLCRISIKLLGRLLVGFLVVFLDLIIWICSAGLGGISLGFS